MFEAGQKVDVQGVSIGKGYAGTIKRYNFGSGRATHGNSRSHNVPGSIGMAQDPGRVFPGKRMTGHMGDVTVTTQNLEIARIDAAKAAEMKAGEVVAASLFEVGQKVDVQGVSIGKGYAGTIKRYNFASGRASHGNSRSHNVPGSIGMAQDPGRVFPGKRMTGHMGDVKTTVQNLEIARIDAERQLLLVKGAVPGAKNGQVVVLPAIKVKAKKGA
jgi:large subunit ribosomal protein L3